MEKKLLKAINEQINKEFFSAYLYLSMAAYFETLGLGGCAAWMKVQSKEEVSHAMKFFGYVNDRGGAVELAAIDQPDVKFRSVRDVFEKTLKHEKVISASIISLYRLAQSSKDAAAEIFLHWFIDEQVEEEKNASDVLAMLDYVKQQDSAGMLMFDKALGARAQK